MMTRHTFIAVLFWSITLCETYTHNLCTDAQLVDGLMRVCLRSLPDDDVIIDWYRNRMKQGNDHPQYDNQGQDITTEATNSSKNTQPPDSETTSPEVTTLPASSRSESTSATTLDLSELQKFIDNLRHLLHIASYNLDHSLPTYTDVEKHDKKKDLPHDTPKGLRNEQHLNKDDTDLHKEEYKDLHDDNYKDLHNEKQFDRDDTDTGKLKNDHNRPFKSNRKIFSTELSENDSDIRQEHQVESSRSVSSVHANANDSMSNNNQHSTQELSSFRHLDELATELARSREVGQMETNTKRDENVSFIRNQPPDYETNSVSKQESVDYRHSGSHEIKHEEVVSYSKPPLASPYKHADSILTMNKSEYISEMTRESNDVLELLSRPHRRVPRSSPIDGDYSNTDDNLQESQEKRAFKRDQQPSLRQVILQIKIKQMKQLLNSISTVASQSSNSLLDKLFQFYRVKKYVIEQFSLPTKKSLFDDENVSNDEIEITSDQIAAKDRSFIAEDELLALDHAPGSEARISMGERQIDNYEQNLKSILSFGDNIGGVDDINLHMVKKSPIARAAQNLLLRCCIRGCSDSDLLTFCHSYS